MFNNWIQNLTADNNSQAEPTQQDFQKASAQLLLEVARADFQISDEERSTIIDAIKRATSLPESELAQLIDDAEAQVASAISYHEHVRLINEHFSRKQKIALIEQLWRVAFADHELDQYEEAFIRKIADLIYVKHRDFMQAKLRVMPE